MGRTFQTFTSRIFLNSLLHYDKIEGNRDTGTRCNAGNGDVFLKRSSSLSITLPRHKKKQARVATNDGTNNVDSKQLESFFRNPQTIAIE